MSKGFSSSYRTALLAGVLLAVGAVAMLWVNTPKGDEESELVPLREDAAALHAETAALQAEVPAMIADEYRHARQCAGVVLALGGDPVAPLPAIQALPEHADVSPLEAVLRNVISVGCLSETVAVSVIRAEHAELEFRAATLCERELADPWVRVRPAKFASMFCLSFADSVPVRMFKSKRATLDARAFE